MNDFDKRWLQKTRLLTQALILSMALNVGLLVTLGVRAFSYSKGAHEDGKHFGYMMQVPPSSSIASTLKAYFGFSFFQLIDELMNGEYIEEGLTHRDLALSCLVDYHYFDIDRALQGLEIQRRCIRFIHHEGEEVQLNVFPGLSDQHFTTILRFVMQEKWPLTPEGLFVELKYAEDEDASLQEALKHTEHFQLVQKLFERAKDPMDDTDLIRLLKEGEWKYLERFVRSQKISIDLSKRMYEAFLMQYLEGGSAAAVMHVIESNLDALFSHIEDNAFVKMIESIDIHSDKIDRFLKRMLLSVRSDEVRKASALKLFELNGIHPPSPYDHVRVIEKFLPHSYHIEEVKRETKSALEKLKEHVVEPGDSLWVIAKKYGVSVDDIVRENHLASRHHLRVGMKLIIP